MRTASNPERLQVALDDLERTIRHDQVWVVLDVDRTIISTTAWYHACMKPDLLIRERDIPAFVTANNDTYGDNPTLSDRQFRKEALGLIGPCNPGKFIHAGRAIAKDLWSYEEPYRYLRYLRFLYGSNLRLLYLTSGYTDFIRGLIETIHERHNLDGITYSVFGSELYYCEKVTSLDFICDRTAKQAVVSQIAKQAKIAFLADDDLGNVRLFDLVEEQGGQALRIVHKGNETVNGSWSRFVESHMGRDVMKCEIMNLAQNYSLYDTSPIESDHASVFAKFESVNELGIMHITTEQFSAACEALLSRIKLSDDKNDLNSVFDRLVFVSKDTVYLRGSIYYHWLPSYIFVDDRTKSEKLRQELQIARDGLKLLDRSEVLEDWGVMSKEEQLLVLCLLDHYKDAIVHILNAVFTISIKCPHLVSDDEVAHMDDIARKTTDVYYGLLFDEPRTKQLHHLLNDSRTLSYIELVAANDGTYQGMRELDDPKVIVGSALSLLRQAKETGKQYDCIIDFPCGGLELGLALLSIQKIVNPNQKQPEIVHCFYSSKKIKRARDFPDYKVQKGILFDLTPHAYHGALDRVLEHGKNILLYDNNAATFSTLVSVKNEFNQTYSLHVDAAVAAVWYDNIVSNFLEEQSAELLNSDWRSALTYKPITEYITAFNTWGTSHKSNLLEAIYFSETNPMIYPGSTPDQSNADRIFKACRIHNIYDLTIALKHGVNAIGIHAVYPDREAYKQSQKAYKPLLHGDVISDNLPVATYECASIRAMQAMIPDSVMQVLVIEREVSVAAMIETIKAYGMDLSRVVVQLHYRCSKDHIDAVKDAFNRVIVTLGAFQQDFSDYYGLVERELRAESDYILVDFSKHQPDLIQTKANEVSGDPVAQALHISKYIQNNKVPVLIADDVPINDMRRYLEIFSHQNVLVAGIDMQNILELNPSEQRYRLIRDGDEVYQMRIRKSPDAFMGWRDLSLEI